MKYRLNEKARNDADGDIIGQILENRDVDPDRYMNVDYRDSENISPLKHIDETVYIVSRYMELGRNIGIVVDEDVDGFCSASMIYRFIRDTYRQFNTDTDEVRYILHTKPKVHGLTDLPDYGDIDLMIIPDAGTNDIEQCRELYEKGIQVVILDHHEIAEDNPYATVVSSMDGYDNKYLSGSGVAYKFLKKLNDDFAAEYSGYVEPIIAGREGHVMDNIDIAALGIIGDVMDIRTYENRYICQEGLKNINNKFLKALIRAQDYSMNGIVTIHNIQWYIVPLMNAMIRIGSPEEKEIMFRALCETDEVFDYRKRGSDKIIKESIYDRAARLCRNAKNRHDKKVRKSFDELKYQADEQKDSRFVFVDADDDFDGSLTGLVASKIATYAQKPCLLVHKDMNGDSYSGSGRNISKLEDINFMDMVNDTGDFVFARGHQSAFGVKIKEENITRAITDLNDAFRNVPNEKEYVVDFDIPETKMSLDFIRRIDRMKPYYGTGIDEAMVACHIGIERDDVEVIGRNDNTFTYLNQLDIKYIMFSCDEDNGLLEWANDDFGSGYIEVTIVGKPGMNTYNGIETPQFVIEDFTIDYDEDKDDDEDHSYYEDMTDYDEDYDDPWA